MNAPQIRVPIIYRCTIYSSEDGAHRPLKFQLRAEPGVIAVDEGGRHRSSALEVGDRAVAGRDRPIDPRLLPTLAVPDISEAEVVLLRPEERHAVESFARPKDVARRRLALTLGHHPVLDADRFAAKAVRPTGDV